MKLKSEAFALLLTLMFLSGCKKQPPEPEGYRVTDYNGANYEWTIIRTGTFDGTFFRKRLIVVCESFKSGNSPPVTGPEACALQVGRLIVPNSFPRDGNNKHVIDVFEMGGQDLSIMEGDGDDKVAQLFKIVKYEIIQ